MKYARWIGLAALVLLALPTAFFTCYMLVGLGPKATVGIWIYLIYDWIFGVLA